MRARVKCKACDRLLTDWLEPVAADFEVEWRDNENIIPAGHYWIGHGLAGGREQPGQTLDGRMFVHLNQRTGMPYHPDINRNYGCCGRDGCNGPNLKCQCGAEVATEVSDCWTSYYIHFEPEVTELVDETTH